MKNNHRARPLPLGAAVAALIAGLFAAAPHRAVDAQAPRALPGPVEEVYADPVDLMYSYGPSEGERASLRSASAFTATITVTYDAGFGANAQAQAAFQAAADVWKSVIASNVPIRVRAFFRDLSNPNVLGSAGPAAICTTPNGLPNTAYAAALVDKLNGSAGCAAAAGETHEIVANFNSTFTNWDFGTSGTPVAGKYNFMTVVLHELGHGLGFYGSMTASGGIGSFGYGPNFPNIVDIYDRAAVTGGGAPLIGFANPSAELGAQLVSNNTFFSGGNARARNGGINPRLETHSMTTQYSVPSDGGFVEGSSYSHLDDVAYTGTPNGLMTFRLAQAEVFTDPGPIVRGIFADEGWTITGCTYALSSSSFTTSGKATTSSVSVTAGTGCGWTATSNASWLTVVAGGSGGGNGTVTFAVAANGGGARTGTLTIAGLTFTVTQGAHVTLPGDFDGDGKADITVFRPSTGTWFTTRSTGGTAGVQWGNSSDVPVPGDYDGDGRIDVAVFRPGNGTWFIINSSTGGAVGIQWGNSSDRPVHGDYDGDGKTDVAVFRPSNGTWLIVNSSTGGATGVQWGNSADVTVPGDYDGDGKTDVAVFRPATGTWFIVNSGTGATTGIQWGNSADVTVPGDYDGDGRTDVAVFRPSSGTWFIVRSSTGATTGLQWGNSADVPVPGDYDGDGKTDAAVFRPSNGTWFIVNSSTGTTTGVQWGNSADIPILKRP
jgi:putative transposon-encoded protein